MKTTNKPIILTSGDPAGVGPEVAVKAFKSLASKDFPFRYCGIANVLQEAIDLYAPGWELEKYSDKNWKENTVYYDDFDLVFPENWEKCVASAECGKLSYDLVYHASIAVIAKEYSAIVTAPIGKESVNMAGIQFSGHTEFIASLCDYKNFNMMQSADNMRFVLPPVIFLLLKFQRQQHRENTSGRSSHVSKLYCRGFGEPKIFSRWSQSPCGGKWLHGKRGYRYSRSSIRDFEI